MLGSKNIITKDEAEVLAEGLSAILTDIENGNLEIDMTAEDIHMVCLFKSLDDAAAFDGALDSYRVPIPNRPDIFGRQLVMDCDDNIISEVENILSFDDIYLDDCSGLSRCDEIDIDYGI